MKKTTIYIFVIIIIIGIATLLYRFDGSNFGDDVVVETEETEPWLRVVSPNGGEELEGGEEYTIRWESRNIGPNEEVTIWYERYDRLWEIVTTKNTGFVTVRAPYTPPGTDCSRQGTNVFTPIDTIFSGEYYISVHHSGTVLKRDTSDDLITLTGLCTGEGW